MSYMSQHIRRRRTSQAGQHSRRMANPKEPWDSPLGWLAWFQRSVTGYFLHRRCRRRMQNRHIQNRHIQNQRIQNQKTLRTNFGGRGRSRLRGPCHSRLSFHAQKLSDRLSPPPHRMPSVSHIGRFHAPSPATSVRLDKVAKHVSVRENGTIDSDLPSAIASALRTSCCRS